MDRSLGSSRPRAAGSASTYLAVGIGPRPWRRRPEGLARPLASVPSVRAGRRESCQVSSLARPRSHPVHAFLVSTGIVALAEIGDKTQLLALMLAARFQRPWPIIAGILIATLANHAGADIAGSLLGSLLTGEWLRWGVGLTFLAMAVWALIPDRYEEDRRARSRGGAFVTTVVVFFLAEIGDKTQVATIALAARFEQLYPVVIG